MIRMSGIGTYIEELLPRVIEAWRGAQFTILGDPQLLPRIIPPSARVDFRRFDAGMYSAREQVDFMRVIPRETDLLWVPHFNVPLLYKRAMAVTVHDVFHLASADVPRLNRLYASLLFRSVIRNAAVVLCDSAFTAAELRRLVGEPRHLKVVPLGVGGQWAKLPPRLPSTQAPYLLVVGNVKPHKNLKRLVAAFARAAEAIPHRLVIVGRREGLRTLDTEVEALAEGLGARVEFTGFVSRAVLEQYVANCAALVQPSVYEGFGLPPLEAMAAGRPVAVSSAASLPEVCGPEAEYFDPFDVDSIADALRRVVQPAAQAADAVARRMEWARRFDWDACAAATSTELAAAAGSPPRARAAGVA
jgi:glycosyltransferase involved in cell wall biosynthesis